MNFGRDMIQSITKHKAESVYCSILASAVLKKLAVGGPRAARQQEPVKREACTLGIQKDQTLGLIFLRFSGYCSLSRSPVNTKTKSASNLVITSCSVISKLV